MNSQTYEYRIMRIDGARGTRKSDIASLYQIVEVRHVADGFELIDDNPTFLDVSLDGLAIQFDKVSQAFSKPCLVSSDSGFLEEV